MSAHFQESVAAKGHVKIPDSDALAAFMGSYVTVAVLILSGSGGPWCCTCPQHWKRVDVLLQAHIQASETCTRSLGLPEVEEWI